MKYNNKTIVFIPTYDYLSNKLFLSFLNDLHDYNTVYINHDEFQMIEKHEDIISSFSKYMEVHAGYSFSKNKNIFQKLKKIFIENKTLQNKLLKTIKDINPDLIITTSDMSISFKGIKPYCDASNIPTVLIQPSFFDYEETYKIGIKHIIRNIINFFLNIYPKQILWGNEYKSSILFLWGSLFQKYYKNERDIRIIGNPIYDSYCSESLSATDKEAFKSKFGIVSQQIITICTEAFGGLISEEHTLLLFKFYSEIINTNKSAFFIIKLHPRDSVEDIQSRLNLNSSNYVLVSNDYSLREIIEISNVQVSVASASSLEAILLNIPVILINPENLININDFFDNSVELRASNVTEFSNCLDLIFSMDWQEKFKSNRKIFLSKYLSSLGQASLNILKAIKDILND